MRSNFSTLLAGEQYCDVALGEIGVSQRVFMILNKFPVDKFAKIYFKYKYNKKILYLYIYVQYILKYYTSSII